MLETLLHIGKTLRESENGLKHHRYIKPAPKRGKKTDVIYLVLPIREDFSFDFGNLQPTTDQYLIEKFFYLNYKTSDNDSSVKYLWGDILYSISKEGKEQGTYRIDEKKNAFMRANRDEDFFVDTAISKFRTSFARERTQIEELLAEKASKQLCYLHFSFGGKHWYQFENELRKLNEKMLEEFLDKQKDQYVLRKYLYKTLSSPEKDLKFPDFSKNNMYKTKTFKNIDEVMDLFYAVDFSLKDIIWIDKIKINVLPKSNNLKAEQIEEYFYSKGLGKHATAVGVIDAYNQPDDFFAPFASDIAKNFTQFDVVFSKTSGGSSPDVDVIELAGLERDSLVELNERIKDIRQEVEAKREMIVGKSDKTQPLRIRQSFSNVLGDFSKVSEKKYQSHLLKVLPQIYKGNYYNDQILLPAFIEKVQFETRNYEEAKAKGKRPFNHLKFDYEFLLTLRNSSSEQNGENEMAKMKDNEIYKIGLLLGHLAQPVSRDINSFEKGFVGLLLRHISDLQGLVKLSNFINSKLSIHGRLGNKVRKRSIELENVIGTIDPDALPNYAELSVKVDSMISEIDERSYNSEFCAFGFFEGYFAKYLKSQEEATPVTSDYEN